VLDVHYVKATSEQQLVESTLERGRATNRNLEGLTAQSGRDATADALCQSQGHCLDVWAELAKAGDVLELSGGAESQHANLVAPC
jgi:hypothetical protein